MPTVKGLGGAALACIAMLGIHAPALAQQAIENVQPETFGTQIRTQATDRALLEALLKRRAEVARSASGPQSHRAALDFLDQRIAEVRSRIES